MDNQNRKTNQGMPEIDIAELIQEKINFNIQNPNTKPINIALMTGNNQNKGSEKK